MHIMAVSRVCNGLAVVSVFSWNGTGKNGCPFVCVQNDVFKSLLHINVYELYLSLLGVFITKVTDTIARKHH